MRVVKPSINVNLNMNLKWPLMMVGLAGLLVFSAWVVSYFIPTEKYETLVRQVAREMTGHDINIVGKPTLSLLPEPMLEIPNVELQTAEAGSRVPSLRVASIKAYTTFSSIFSGKPQITSLVLEQPSVAIERGLDKHVQWDWLGTDTLTRMTSMNTAGEAGKMAGAPQMISIVGGTVNYVNPRVNYSEQWENVNFTLIPGQGGSGSLTGSMTMRGHDLSINGNIDAPQVGAKNEEAAFVLSVKAESGNVLEIKGTRTVLDNKPIFKGDLEMFLTDLLTWVPNTSSEKQDINKPLTRGAVEELIQPAVEKTVGQLTEEVKPFPIQMSAKITQRADMLEVSDAKLDLTDAKGAGSIRVNWSQVPDIEMKLTFDRFNVMQWKALAEGWVLDIQRARNQKSGTLSENVNEDDLVRNPLADDITLKLDLQADSMEFGDAQWSNVVTKAELADGAVTINQLSVDVSKESKLTMFGLISYVSRGLRFEGNLETNGHDLRSVLTLFNEEAANLPKRGLAEKFAFTSNLFISSQQLRVSEAQLKIAGLELIGGLVAYFEAKPRVEAEIRLQDIDLDYFRDTWREEKMKERETGFTLIPPKRHEFKWLKNLATKIDFKVVIDRFTFLEKQGDMASFRLFADTGEIGLYGIKLLYPDSVLDGSLLLDVKGEEPALDIICTTNAFNTRYFVANPRLADLPAPPPPPPPPGTPPEQANNKWSEDLYDMRWAAGWRAAIDLNIGELTHDNNVFDNFKLKAKLDNETLTIKKLSFGLWGGGFEGAGSLVMGKVPATSMSFTFYNAEIREMIASISSLANLSGRMSISGMFSTSGINMLSWIERADIKMVVAGRGVWARGFNLQGVIDAVNAARSVADVVNNVNLNITEGNTEFSVDGNINVQNGVMRTPGITLRSGSVIGNLDGSLKVIPWLVEGRALFQFPSFASETVPTMELELTGSGDEPNFKIDTSSLEAFVAKRIVGR